MATESMSPRFAGDEQLTCRASSCQLAPELPNSMLMLDVLQYSAVRLVGLLSAQWSSGTLNPITVRHNKRGRGECIQSLDKEVVIFWSSLGTMVQILDLRSWILDLVGPEGI